MCAKRVNGKKNPKQIPITDFPHETSAGLNFQINHTNLSLEPERIITTVGYYHLRTSTRSRKDRKFASVGSASDLRFCSKPWKGIAQQVQTPLSSSLLQGWLLQSDHPYACPIPCRCYYHHHLYMALVLSPLGPLSLQHAGSEFSSNWLSVPYSWMPDPVPLSWAPTSVSP